MEKEEEKIDKLVNKKSEREFSNIHKTLKESETSFIFKCLKMIYQQLNNIVMVIRFAIRRYL